ncbi:MAG: FG-GAP-like repeat-containing protein [Pyrinomonadaceae bacterium]
MKKLLHSCGSAFALLFVIATSSFAATFIVTNTNDAGPGSLRQAIADSSGNLQHDIITFDSDLFSSPQTISITTGELVVLSDVNPQNAVYYNVSIVGPGADLLTLDANNQSRILRKASGGGELEISGITVTRGFATQGGGVYSEGSLVISNAVIANNTAAGAEDGPGQFYAGRGGGIYSPYLTLVNTVVRDNIATGIRRTSENPQFGDSGSAGAGGGVFVSSFVGPPQIVNCTFVRNLAQGFDAPQPPSDRRAGGGGSAYGGALYASFGVTIVNSTFLDNSAIGGDGISSVWPSDGGQAWGGALRASGPVIMNSTFTGNLGQGGDSGLSTVNPANSLDGEEALGGAVYGDPKLVNVTITDNAVIGGSGRNGGRGLGGGVYAGDNEFRVANSTITGNRAVGGTGNLVNGIGEGGGFHTGFQTGASRSFTNNIAAENLADTGPDIRGLFPNAQTNLVRIGEGSTGIDNGVNGNLVGTSAAPIEALLGPLSDNGGLTFTRAPLAGSPAIDSGTNSVTNPITSQLLTIDQRNFVRIWPVGGTIDRGSVEIGTPESLPSAAVPDLQALSDSGSSNTDNITTSISPTFDVANTIPGAQIELLRDGTVVSSRTARTFVTSLADLTPPLDGSVTYSVRQTIDGLSTVTGNSLPVTFDHTPPTVTLNQAASQPDPARLSPYNFTAIFSEKVNGAGRILLQGSTANVSSANFNPTSQNSISWNIAISGITSNGEFIVANIENGSYRDIAGNAGSASTSTDNVIYIDNVRPSVSVNQSSLQQDLAFSQPILFSVEFTEKVTELTSSDFSFVGSTANLSQANVEVTGGGQSYSVRITNIRSSGLVRLSLPANRAQDDHGNMNLASTSTDNSVFLNFRTAAFDFDGDKRADVSVFRPESGEWFVYGSQAGFMTAAWGTATDKLAAADYDGDGKTDYSVFRDGVWLTQKSTGGVSEVPWGAAGDVPVPADYDGDGRADQAVFRDGVWWIYQSTAGPMGIAWGAAGDIPVPGDYDGDGRADMAVVRDGTWWIYQSTAGPSGIAWGQAGDKPVPADYDGDGKTDVAIVRDGTWWIYQSTAGPTGVAWGSATDIPAPADYDGDGRADIAIFREGTWWIYQSTAGPTGIPWGVASDIPVPKR